MAHLAEVAAGLHSVVLGEAQILGQVRSGFAEATGELRQAADLAVVAARELRAHTRFESHAGHLLDRALKHGGIRSRQSVLVLGSGQMGRLVAARARETGFTRVVLAGRSRPDALPDGVTYLSLRRALATAEPFTVVVGCLGSGAQELPLADLAPARLVVDLGTPPNFARTNDERVVGLAELFAQEQARPHAMRRRAALARQLHEILDERIGQKEAGRSPVSSLRFEVERVRVRELARMRRLHPDLPGATLDAMSRSLVNQLFHLPSQRLKCEGGEFSARVAELFAP